MAGTTLLGPLLVVPFALQAALLSVDELWFHRRRGLSRWERIGHPLDTASVLACYGWLFAFTPSGAAVPGYVALASASVVFVTKDEGVHARACSAGEHRIHALLFALHPVVLIVAALAWPALHGARPPLPWWPDAAALRAMVMLQIAVTAAFLVWQVVFWNRRSARPMPVEHRARANAEVYEVLGDRWYGAQDDPIALLRAEATHRNPWIAARIADERARSRAPAPAPARARVLDLGCGAGFLANALAEGGHDVTGLDASEGALTVARLHDATRSVRWVRADASATGEAEASFDVVCAMDLLEHVERPDLLVAEAARVLSPGGLFFAHTFNRTPLAWLIVIRAVEWFVKNTPKDLHVYRLFVTPAELRAACARCGLEVVEVRGVRPRITSALVRLAWTGVVPTDFAFRFTSSLAAGYLLVARKQSANAKRW